jgi:hypothetical protein
MITEWTAHLRPEAQEAFKDMVLSSSKVIERLKQMVENRLSTIETPGPESFDSPAWDKKLAFDMGQRKVLGDLVKILTL